ncbi:MAG TPA: ROK family transcriptional regulator [Candidatus Dormibacteraeota bacterium]|nr:ROK family transcriptional regulator [Candidatus Dormibacteraeota bacterium]
MTPIAQRPPGHVPAGRAQQASLRAVNRSLVLDLLRRGGPVSRPALAEQTGLTLPTVAAIVDDLISDGLALDRGAPLASVRGGRRPRLVEFNPQSRWVLGASIGVHRITVAVGDARGELVARLDEPTPTPSAPEPVVAKVAAMARLLMRERGAADAVGICVPGLVERGTGICLAARNLGWDVVPIGHLISEALAVPALVLNSSQASAVAERIQGVSQGVEDLVWIHVGTGIGAGVVSGGRLLRGARGLAGELGHVPVVADGGPPCSCGRTGCLEAVASGAAVVRAAQAAGLRYGPAASPERYGAAEVVAAAAAGDAAAVELLARAGEAVGRAAVGLLHLVNPQQIVLGGAVGEVDGPFTSAFRAALAERAIPFSLAATAIVCSRLGDDAGILGALLVARQQSEPSLQLVLGGAP